MEFSQELRNDVAAGRITVSFRLWKRPRVKAGGRYRVGPATIEVDSIELVPFAAISDADVRRSGESDLEELRRRAAHAGPIADDTWCIAWRFTSSCDAPPSSAGHIAPRTVGPDPVTLEACSPELAGGIVWGVAGLPTKQVGLSPHEDRDHS